MVFSSLRVKSRFDSLARRNGRRVVGARAKLTVPAMRAKKKPAGWTTRQAFLPEGWTSRRTRAWRLYTNHSTELTHSTALAARAAKRRSRSGLMSRSPSEQAKNKKPGGLRPTGSCETQEAEPPGVKALGKQFGAKRAQRSRRNGAGHQCVLRGQELLHGSLVRLAVGRSVMVDLWGAETSTAIAIRQQERCTHAAIGARRFVANVGKSRRGAVAQIDADARGFLRPPPGRHQALRSTPSSVRG